MKPLFKLNDKFFDLCDKYARIAPQTKNGGSVIWAVCIMVFLMIIACLIDLFVLSGYVDPYTVIVFTVPVSIVLLEPLYHFIQNKRKLKKLNKTMSGYKL